MAESICAAHFPINQLCVAVRRDNDEFNMKHSEEIELQENRPDGEKRMLTNLSEQGVAPLEDSLWFSRVVDKVILSDDIQWTMLGFDRLDIDPATKEVKD